MAALDFNGLKEAGPAVSLALLVLRANTDGSVIGGTTATVTSVADNAASVTLLAVNTSRRGATITNDSSARLHIKLGTTATTTDYTRSLAQNESWDVPFGYTGRIDGIWATDPNTGAARITEYV